MVTVYVLKLEYGKYYIGKTNNSSVRIDQHFNNNGNSWTKKYNPIEIVELFSNSDIYDEDKITIKYMGIYGIDNVRGGSFTKLTLNEMEIDIINKMLISTNDKCDRCGRIGHFTNNCKEITFKNGNPITDTKPNKKYNNKYKGDTGIRCSRCHRSGHLSTQCYAKTDISGNVIESISLAEHINNNKYESDNSDSDNIISDIINNVKKGIKTIGSIFSFIVNNIKKT